MQAATYQFEIGETVVNRFCGTLYKVVQCAVLPWLDGDGETYTVLDADDYPHVIVGAALRRAA